MIRMLKRTTLKCSTRGNSPRYVPDTQSFQAKKEQKIIHTWQDLKSEDH